MKEQPQQEQNVQTQPEAKETLWSFLRPLVLAVGVVLLCFAFVAQPRLIIGTSMQNTLQNGDRVIVWKLNYHPQRGDVVTADSQNSLHEDLIKRVLAVGGDHIVVQNGTVTVNGKLLTEPYIKEQQWGGNNVDITLPQGKVFLMGDNRNVSADSRIIGAVDYSHIQGKVVVRLFPFNQIRTF